MTGRRGRSGPPGSAGGGSPAGGVDPDVALFAQWMREEDHKEREARRQAKEARRLEEAARALTAAKDAAAAEVKRLRASPSATAEQRAAADAAYRDALATVVAAETGEAPAWAPDPVTGHVEHDTDADAEAESTGEAGAPATDDAGGADADADGQADDGTSAGDTPEG